jgi:LPXTG-motif cell wall-anchored protein
MVRPIWAMIANHYTKRRGLAASYVTRAAAKAAPEGGGGDYGPNSGGFDQLGFGTLAFSRDRQEAAVGTPGPGPGSGPAGGGVRTQASASPLARDGLAATGSGDVAAWVAAAGVSAVAGGLLMLRRRGRAG